MKIPTLLFVSLFLLGNLYSQSYIHQDKIQFFIKNQEVLLPSKYVKFARTITDYSISGNEEFTYKIQKKKIREISKFTNKKGAKEYLEMEPNDAVIFKFRKNSIRDVNGADIYIFSDSLVGNATISVSKDSKNWVAVGTVKRSKKYINLSGKIPYKERYTFVKIKTSSTEGSKLRINQVATIKSTAKGLGITAKIRDGIVYTESDKVNLQINDFRQFDGDLISVKVNGKTISKTKLLTKWNRFVELPLRKGENKIVVTAKTEGYKKPNTIDLKIVDGVVINIGNYRIRKKKTKTIKIIRGEEIP